MAVGSCKLLLVAPDIVHADVVEADIHLLIIGSRRLRPVGAGQRPLSQAVAFGHSESAGQGRPESFDEAEKVSSRLLG